MFGVETYALPAIGRIYLDGQAGIAPIVTLIYRGLGTVPKCGFTDVIP